MEPALAWLRLLAESDRWTMTCGEAGARLSPHQASPSPPNPSNASPKKCPSALLPAQLHRNADNKRARALPRDELSTQQDLAAPVRSGGTSIGLGCWGRHHLMPPRARACQELQETPAPRWEHGAREGRGAGSPVTYPPENISAHMRTPLCSKH